MWVRNNRINFRRWWKAVAKQEVYPRLCKHPINIIISNITIIRGQIKRQIAPKNSSIKIDQPHHNSKICSKMANDRSASAHFLSLSSIVDRTLNRKILASLWRIYYIRQVKIGISWLRIRNRLTEMNQPWWQHKIRQSPYRQHWQARDPMSIK